MEKFLQNSLDFLHTQRQHMSSLFGLITLLLLFAYNPIDTDIANFSLTNQLAFAEQTQETVVEDNVVVELAEVEEVALAQHKVVTGDSLWKIAEEHLGDGSRWSELLEVNENISNPGSIEVGMEVTLPVSVEQNIATNSVQSNNEYISYTIKAGDNLWSLSQNHLGNSSNWQEILELNNIDPYNLPIGEKLLLPIESNSNSNIISYAIE